MFVAHTHTTRRRRKPGSCNNDRRDLLEWGEERERGGDKSIDHELMD